MDPRLQSNASLAARKWQEKKGGRMKEGFEREDGEAKLFAQSRQESVADGVMVVPDD